VVWRNSSVLVSIIEVNSRRAQLVGLLGWVTVQFPVPDIYLAMCSATQINSAWLSIRGKAQ